MALATPDYDVTFSAPKDVPKQAADVKERYELPPGTKSYSVWAIDRNNEKQINETHKWLKDIVKDKSKLHMWMSFPWGGDKEVPEDELQELYDEGRFDDIDKYQKVGGWQDAILDAAGYDAVVKKTKWISDVTPTYKTVEMTPVDSSTEPGDARVQSTKVRRRDELPPGTKSYIAWVANRDNENQINETQDWLHELVKDKSKMRIWRSFTWESADDVPEDEIKKLYDEGRFDDIDNYKKVGGWMGIILDEFGVEEIKGKKEWIRAIEQTPRAVAMNVHEPEPEREPELEPEPEPKRANPYEDPDSNDPNTSLPPGTKSYSAWPTDRTNEPQIAATHEWLKGLVKAPSKLHMWRSFPWKTDEEIPEADLQRLWDEDRWADVDKFQLVGGWMGCVLDEKGVQEVRGRTEWIRDLTPTYRPVAM